MMVFSIGRVEEWKKVNADHHNGQGAPDSLGTFTERIVHNGEAMSLEASTTINAPYIGETSMQTVEKRWDGKDPGWIEAHIEPTHRIRLAKFEGLKPRLSRMMLIHDVDCRISVNWLLETLDRH
jgi:hypothetical protein